MFDGLKREEGQALRTKQGIGDVRLHWLDGVVVVAHWNSETLLHAALFHPDEAMAIGDFAAAHASETGDA